MPAPSASALKLSPVPGPAEQPFIVKLQSDIPARYGTLKAASAAGYFQYTGEDNTGAISYVNLKVADALDLDTPNQLWYDVNGRLLGVDYTVLEERSPSPPASLFGYAVDPSRWLHRARTCTTGSPLPTVRSNSARCRCRSSPTRAAC